MNNLLQSQRWLLRDKYHFSEAEILEILNGNSEQKSDQEFSAVLSQLAEDLKRIEGGEPIQYVIGWVPFLDCQIDLSLRPLIPRPETEYWTEQVIKDLKEQSSPLEVSNLKVLDLCCGSGCIGIALLKHLPFVQVEFVDINPLAVQQTQINLSKNQVDFGRVKLTVSNLFAQLPLTQYDLIVCNPPYVDEFGEYSENLSFEPEQALFAQKSGLSLIEEVIFESRKYLKPSRRLFLEFGFEQEKMIEEVIQKAEWNSYEFHQDQFEVMRWVEIKK